MITGLDLIEGRPLKDIVDIDALEKKYKITLPPIFRVFAESFRWKPDVTGDRHFYYYPELSGGEVYFPFPTVESNIVSTSGMTDDEIDERKFILIAENRYGIFLGTAKGEEDKIFMKMTSVEGSFKCIADTIFEFLRGITDNLLQLEATEKEYRSYMTALGYEGEDLEDEVNYWKSYKASQGDKNKTSGSHI